VPGKSVVAKRVKGTVKIKLPGTNTFIDLSATRGVPVGATVDTRHGTVQLTSVQKQGGKLQTALFFDGLFKLTQTRTTTDLTLNEPLAPCRRHAHAAAVAAKKPKTRKLWGSGHGSFRTKGQYSAATVRGTEWLVQDSCAGTLTRVAHGVAPCATTCAARRSSCAPARSTWRGRGASHSDDCASARNPATVARDAAADTPGERCARDPARCGAGARRGLHGHGHGRPRRVRGFDLHRNRGGGERGQRHPRGG
jgi:hypothetical protein